MILMMGQNNKNYKKLRIKIIFVANILTAPYENKKLTRYLIPDEAIRK
jgi:hypothetical protein